MIRSIRVTDRLTDETVHTETRDFSAQEWDAYLAEMSDRFDGRLFRMWFRPEHERLDSDR